MSSNGNRDKKEITAFTPIEGFRVGQIVKSVRDQSQNFQDSVDLITSDRSLRISDNRGKIAKQCIKYAERVILAYQEPDKLGSLSAAQQSEILMMLDDLIQGRREAVQFQMTQSCDGIKELFSNREFLFNQSKSGKQ